MFLGAAGFFGFDLFEASFDLNFFVLGTNGGRGQTLSGRSGYWPEALRERIY